MNLRGLAVCACAALLLFMALAARSQGAASAPRLDVLPYPGTPDASPRTQIDFPALAPSQLANLAVSGSRSGIHQGALGTMGGGRGAAFVPSKQFTAGEQVTVRGALRSGTRIGFAFVIARPVSMPENAATTAASENSGAVDGAVGVVHATNDANGFTRSFRSDASFNSRESFSTRCRMTLPALNFTVARGGITKLLPGWFGFRPTRGFVSRG